MTKLVQPALGFWITKHEDGYDVHRTKYDAEQLACYMNLLPYETIAEAKAFIHGYKQGAYDNRDPRT